MRDRLGPRESIPVECRRLARLERDSLAPCASLQRIARLCRCQMKRSLECRLQIFGCEQPPQLDRGLVIHALLQVRIHQIFDRVRKLVPNELTVLASRMLQRRLGCLQIAGDDAIPFSQARIDMSRHVQRVWIARRDLAVLVRDFERVVFTPGHIVGVNQVVHGARMIRISGPHTREDFGRTICMRPRRGRRRRCEMCERVERGRLRIVRKPSVELLHRGLPTANARPVVARGRLGEECFGRCNEELLAWRRRSLLRLLNFVPALQQPLRSRARRPERLKQRHRDAPVRHCATRLDFRHALKRFARLRIGHVMQQRDGAIELDLRRPRARYGKSTVPRDGWLAQPAITAANAATKMTRNKILLLSECAGAAALRSSRALSSTVNGLVRPRSRY